MVVIRRVPNFNFKTCVLPKTHKTVLKLLTYNSMLKMRPTNPNPEHNNLPSSFLCDLLHKFQYPLLLSLVSLISMKINVENF